MRINPQLFLPVSMGGTVYTGTPGLGPGCEVSTHAQTWQTISDTFTQYQTERQKKHEISEGRIEVGVGNAGVDEVEQKNEVKKWLGVIF